MIADLLVLNEFKHLGSNVNEQIVAERSSRQISNTQ